eukprot:508305-Lingulodinium_polyedra.AAC.1
MPLRASSMHNAAGTEGVRCARGNPNSNAWRRGWPSLKGPILLELTKTLAHRLARGSQLRVTKPRLTGGAAPFVNVRLEPDVPDQPGDRLRRVVVWPMAPKLPVLRAAHHR